jgi:hypothetical protein
MSTVRGFRCPNFLIVPRRGPITDRVRRYKPDGIVTILLLLIVNSSMMADLTTHGDPKIIQKP